MNVDTFSRQGLSIMGTAAAMGRPWNRDAIKPLYEKGKEGKGMGRPRTCDAIEPLYESEREGRDHPQPFTQLACELC